MEIKVGDRIRIAIGFMKGLLGTVAEVGVDKYLIYFDNETYSWQHSYKVFRLRKRTKQAKIIRRTIWR